MIAVESYGCTWDPEIVQKLPHYRQEETTLVTIVSTNICRQTPGQVLRENGRCRTSRLRCNLFFFVRTITPDNTFVLLHLVGADPAVAKLCPITRKGTKVLIINPRAFCAVRNIDLGLR